jgi:hypothetical protein
MRCWFPELRLTALEATLDEGDDDRFGGRGRGFPADRWPVDPSGSPRPLIARLGHDPDRLDLGRHGRVLYVFLAREWYDHPWNGPLQAGGTAVVLEPEELDPRSPGLSPEAYAYPEAVVVRWREGDDGIRSDDVADLSSTERFRNRGWSLDGFAATWTFKLGGAPCWTGNGPIHGLPPGLRYLGQLHGYYRFDGEPPEPDAIGAPRITWPRTSGPLRTPPQRTMPRVTTPDAPDSYHVQEGSDGWEVPFADFASDGVGYLLAEDDDPPTVHFPITR